MTAGAVLLAMAIALQAPPPATDRVVVIAGDDPDFAGVVEAAFRARGLRMLDDNERHGLSHHASAAPGDREVVRTRLLAARAAWRQLDLAAAEAGASAAITEALRLERPEDHIDLIVDGLVFLAALQLGQGAAADGMANLRLATRLEPERATLDAALHPPSMVQAWTDARASNAAAAVSVVVVRPRLIGAAVGDNVEVRIDGVVADVADGLAVLPRGPHVLTVRAPGCQTHSRIVDVDADDVVVEDVMHVEADIAARARLVAAVRAGDDSALGHLLDKTGALLIVALDADGRVLAERRGDPPVQVALASDPVILVDAILLATTPVVASSPMRPPAVAGPDDVPWGWLAGTAGVVALGMATAVVVWAVVPGEPPPPPPRPVVTIWGVQ